MKTYTQISRDSETITHEGVANIINAQALQQLIEADRQAQFELQNGRNTTRFKLKLVAWKNLDEGFKIFGKNYVGKIEA